VAQSWKAPLT